MEWGDQRVYEFHSDDRQRNAERCVTRDTPDAPTESLCFPERVNECINEHETCHLFLWQQHLLLLTEEGMRTCADASLIGLLFSCPWTQCFLPLIRDCLRKVLAHEDPFLPPLIPAAARDNFTLMYPVAREEVIPWKYPWNPGFPCECRLGTLDGAAGPEERRE